MSETRTWNSLDAIKALAVVTIAIPIARYWEAQMSLFSHQARTVQIILVMVTTYLIILFVVLYFSLVKYGLDWKDLGFRKFSLFRGILLGILWFIIIRVLVFIYGLAISLIASITRVNPPEEIANRIPDAFGAGYSGLLIAIVIAVIIAPVVEEMFFRGFLYPAFKRRIGVGWAIFITAVIFGISHASPWLMVPTAIIGGCLAYLYEKEGSLGPPIILHSLNNLVSIIIVYSLYT